MSYNFAQTFYIHSDKVMGADYVNVPRVRIYPTKYPKVSHKESANLPDPAVEVAICEVDSNGHPLPESILFGGSCTMTRSGMLAARVSGWVPFEFELPVLVQTNKLYAIIISNQGDSDFRYGTLKKKLSSAEKKQGLSNHGNYVDGKLLQLADGVPQEIVGHDLTFEVYVAKATRSSVTFDVLNENFEFLTVSGATRAFTGDEIVYDANTENHSFSNATLTFSHLSRAVTATGGAFTSDFSPGDVIIYTDAPDANSMVSNTDYNVGYGIVTAVTDDNNLLLSNEAEFDTSNGHYYVAPAGRVYVYGASSNKLILFDSRASNSTHRFTSDSYLIGVDSLCEAKVSSVDNFNISRVTPELNVFIPNGTDVTFDIGFANSSYYYSDSNLVKSTVDANTDITGYPAIVASRSNEVENFNNLFANDPSADSRFKYKSVKGTLTLTTENVYTAPVVYEELMDFFVYNTVISANSTPVEEITGLAPESAKYVSKTVTLAEGLDAEDLRVYMTAYKPAGTNIKVYAKVMNNYDPEIIDSKMWTELQIVQASSDVSPDGVAQGVEQGYIEYEYGFDTKPSGFSDGGYTLVSSQTITTGGANTISFGDTGPANTALAASDVVMIINEDNPTRPVIAAIDSVTISGDYITGVQLQDNIPSGSSVVGAGFKLYKLGDSWEETAFLNAQNNNILRYYDNGIKYDTFKSYAIKIALYADNPEQAPRVSNYRAIAMSA